MTSEKNIYTAVPFEFVSRGNRHHFDQFVLLFIWFFEPLLDHKSADFGPRLLCVAAAEPLLSISPFIHCDSLLGYSSLLNS